MPLKTFLKISDPTIAEHVAGLIKINDAEEDRRRELDEQEKREKRVAYIKALEEAKKKLPVKAKTNQLTTEHCFKLNYCDGGSPGKNRI